MANGSAIATPGSPRHAPSKTPAHHGHIRKLKTSANVKGHTMQMNQALLTDQSEADWLPAPMHSNEGARMAELLSLDLLNMSDAHLERFTRLATHVFDVPIAYIGLPSGDKNWIKAGVGTDIHSSDRAMSFCGHAIHEPDMLVVPDTWHDPRFANHPIVIGSFKIRFYAGAVIWGRHGEPLGTFCIVGTEPRTFSENDRTKLRHLRDAAQEQMVDFALKRKHLEAAMHDARLDEVTGLLNEAGLQERLEQGIQWAQSGDGSSFSVFIVKVVKFNEIKHGRGPAVTKAVLQAVGRTLTETLTRGCIHGRWREDVFLTIVPYTTPDDALADVGRQLIAAFDAPFDVEGKTVPIRVHVGVSCFPSDGRDGRTLADAAEHAISDLISTHASSFALADQNLNTVMRERLDMERRLREAIDESKLSVVYQPKINVRGEQVSEAEALVRWTDPELGNVPPDRFIPIAEAAGLIDALGAFVLKKACEDAVTWSPDTPGKSSVAVNVSMLQIEDPAFLDTLRDVLDQTGLSPDRLILELTESTLMTRASEIRDNMSAIAALGVRFAIDDFGTGYANFNYLRDLPIHSLKVDKTFVDNIAEHENHARICHAMVTLGRTLGLDVVAEGVETSEQAIFLKAYGCDQLQGFHFSKPLSSDDFRRYVQDRNGSAQV
ncbi:EAL domain-containing protein [Rhodobacteraceae bacterium W635]|uniref:putative bifunctional diguanylate cyclase/phosphodiesterase n=1 Tax=Nioella halotolerans TaxID=2303578 RepID=UPI000E3E1816|nr:EAL domain-containing protein [Rhodobacteraceae bacterium W635]